MEESNTPEPSTRSDDPFCGKIRKEQRKRTCKTEKKICNLKGKLNFVGSEIAHLESRDCSCTVIFNRDNAILFGVPMKGLRLDQIFRTGMVLCVEFEPKRYCSPGSATHYCCRNSFFFNLLKSSLVATKI